MPWEATLQNFVALLKRDPNVGTIYEYLGFDHIHIKHDMWVAGLLCFYIYQGNNRSNRCYFQVTLVNTS